jgi:hypothetical protein
MAKANGSRVWGTGSYLEGSGGFHDPRFMVDTSVESVIYIFRRASPGIISLSFYSWLAAIDLSLLLLGHCQRSCCLRAFINLNEELLLKEEPRESRSYLEKGGRPTSLFTLVIFTACHGFYSSNFK